MGDKSKIEWTDSTWNPVTGCSKVSPGCENCYAERQAVGRLKGKKGYPGLPWTKVNAATNVVLHPDRLEIPLRAKRPRMYFVNSMSDLFHEEVPNEFLDRVFAVMALTPQHTYQVLTKRAERMWQYFAPGQYRDLAVVDVALSLQPDAPLNRSVPEWPLPNVWLGVSVEDQKRADERIPLLLRTHAPVYFISAEPLLGPLDLGFMEPCDHKRQSHRDVGCWMALDWIIVGGESGPRRRAMNLDWARSIRDQCEGARIPFFMKQVDKVIPVPSDLAIREMPRG